jgi:site-specific DNA recombinase
MAVTYSRSHTGRVYDYFYCLGRQHHPGSCEQSVVRVHTVEKLIADHYRSIALPADQVARISTHLKEALSDRREEAEAAEGQLTLRIQRLNHERTKLLQLHYADAVPIELFKSEQERITRELENARQGLASISLEFDQIEQNMTRALELARDCHSAYVAAPERVRRHFNQAFFEKIYVRDDGEVRHDLAEPFRILLDPELSNRLRQSQKQRRTVRSINEEDRAQGAAVGSNVELLVEVRGFEPLTFWLPAKRSPS